MALLPVDVQLMTDLTLADEPNRTDAVYGGMTARDDGTPECTLGWTVENPNGPPFGGSQLRGTALGSTKH